jgi:nitrite reductase/ring-hydroxylating ferredoxin subunit
MHRREMIVHGADRPVLLCRHEGEVFALDNRCPHPWRVLAQGISRLGLTNCEKQSFLLSA